MEPAKLIDLLSPYSACDISDALSKLSITGHIPDLRLYTAPQKVIGFAYTAEFVSLDTKSDVQPHPVDTCPSGSILVYKVPQGMPNAVFGGLNCTRAKIRGCAGVLIQGRFRDLDEILESKMSVWATGQSTLSPFKFTKVGAVGHELCMGNDHYKVAVRTGDVIVADVDGCVVIPIERLDDVLKEAKSLLEIDQERMEEIKNGSTVLNARKKYHQ